METLLFILVTSGMGVVFGWQPMPDGTPSYECIVQLEPELVDTLSRGDSIPIALEVPEDIRPVGRIRIVVGSDSLPQQRLVTKLKPLPDSSGGLAHQGIRETQFSTQNSNSSARQDRYGTSSQTPQPVLPPTGSNDSRNTADVVPPAAGRNIATTARDSTQALGNDLRTTRDDVREDIRQLFGGGNTDSEKPAKNPYNSEILPQRSSPSTDASHADAILPQGSNDERQSQILPADSKDSSSRRQRLDQPIGNNEVGNWRKLASDQQQGDNRNNNGQAVSENDSSSKNLGRPDDFEDSWSLGNRYQLPSSETNSERSESAEDSTNSSATPFSRSPSQVLPRSNHQAPEDFDSETDSGLSVADNRSSRASDNSTSVSPNSRRSSTPGSTRLNSASEQKAKSPVAEIRQEMLESPASANLQTANGKPVDSPPAANEQTRSNRSQTVSDFDWNTKEETPAQEREPAPSASESTSVFPLILSWVLLSGSGVGNLFLFWNYLDVRNKYRDLVYESSRKGDDRYESYE